MNIEQSKKNYVESAEHAVLKDGVILQEDNKGATVISEQMRRQMLTMLRAGK